MRTTFLLPLGTALAGLIGCGLHVGPATAPAPAPAAPAQAATKIGFVYVSPVGEAGWTYQHELGRKEMEANLKGQVAVQTVENVPEGADAVQAISQLIHDGCKVVFTTSFGYMNQTVRAAAANPDVTFFHATGFRTGKNLGVYNARFYEGRYLCGVIAGRMTRTHVAGVVAAYPIPEVLQGINAFTLGMRSVDLKAEVRVIWVNAWYDPAKEREATLALIAQGADMITHHTDSTAVVQAVEESHRQKPVYSFSYHSDMAKFGPNSELTGCTHVWGEFYTRTVKEVLSGDWTGTSVWGGFREGMIQLAPFNPIVPAEVKQLVGKLRDQIASGQTQPFAGPVLAQDGTVKVPAGAVMTDAELSAMNYYVQGVSSSLN
jgi:simple sugar transport system substrate-binding protein